MPDRIVLDLESRSDADLKKVGVYVYSADPTTSITHVGFKLNGSPVRVWRPGQEVIPNTGQRARRSGDGAGRAQRTVRTHHAGRRTGP